MTKEQPRDEIGEFGLIQRIQKKWGGNKRAGLFLGIGDDAAAILPTAGHSLLLTTDILIEQVHFDFSFSTYTEIGYKALSVNVSDIAAMGGRPLYFLVSLGHSGAESVSHIDQLYRGIHRASLEAKISLIGGNIAHSPSGFFVSITLVGEAPKETLLTRSGGRAGDWLYVTGVLGDAAAGLDILKEKGGQKSRLFSSLIKKHKMPKPRLREGCLLAQQQIPSAMIDLSDSLSSDLSHLTDQSGVGAELWMENIPISVSLKRYAKARGVDPLSYALYGGEDYELLFSVPEKKREKIEKLIRGGELSARPIGRLLEKRRGLLVKDTKGRTRALVPRGHDHLMGASKKMKSNE